MRRVDPTLDMEADLGDDYMHLPVSDIFLALSSLQLEIMLYCLGFCLVLTAIIFSVHVSFLNNYVVSLEYRFPLSWLVVFCGISFWFVPMKFVILLTVCNCYKFTNYVYLFKKTSMPS